MFLFDMTKNQSKTEYAIQSPGCAKTKLCTHVLTPIYKKNEQCWYYALLIVKYASGNAQHY